MEQLGADAAPPRSLAALVAVAHLARDAPDASPRELATAAGYVDTCVADMPDVTRAGVRLASAAAYVALSLIGGAPYRRQVPEQRARGAQILGRANLPMISEFNRLTRGLGLVAVYEARSRLGESPVGDRARR